MFDALKQFFIEQEADVKRKIVTVPNAITAAGILLTVVYMYMYWANVLTVFIPAVVVLVGVSDVLDGLAARKLDRHSYLGKLLDPLRDRFLGLAILVNIAIVGATPVIYLLALVIVLIELEIGYINLKKERKNRTGGSVHTAGKIRMLVHGMCGAVFVAQTYWPALNIWPLPVDAVFLVGIMTVASVVALAFYASQKN